MLRAKVTRKHWKHLAFTGTSWTRRGCRSSPSSICGRRDDERRSCTFRKCRVGERSGSLAAFVALLALTSGELIVVGLDAGRAARITALAGLLMAKVGVVMAFFMHARANRRGILVRPGWRSVSPRAPGSCCCWRRPTGSAWRDRGARRAVAMAIARSSLLCSPRRPPGRSARTASRSRRRRRCAWSACSCWCHRPCSSRWRSRCAGSLRRG